MVNRLQLLAVLLAVTTPTAWAQGSVGAEFQINSYTTGGQGSPAVASDANGNLVVVWSSNAQDGSFSGAFGQRFNAGGLQGSEFRVNSYTTGTQYGPSVASDANGNFVVAWHSYVPGSYGSGGFGVYGQRFNASGLPQGNEFQVNSYTPGAQRYPAAASDPNGNFVVVWQSIFQDGSFNGVFGQRFNASGVPQGSEFLANSFNTGHQIGPSVASDANGNFVVVWDSGLQDGSSYGVFGQRFSASGLPQGSEFRVNSYTTSSQGASSVASDANGNFVVVWQSSGQDGSNFGIFGQRFAASGVPQGAEFRANTYTTGSQSQASVASDADGTFVIAWASDGQDGSSFGVFGQRFGGGGPQGAEFRINSYTANRQNSPALASHGDGTFVIAWASDGQDGSSFGVFGQRHGDLIFQDGFE